VHVEDAAEALAGLLERPAPGELLNLASGESPSIAELLVRLVAVTGLTVETREDPERLRPVDVPRLCGDGSRLAAHGFRPRRTLDEALADLWREARERLAVAR
jgi:GDP-4-dehydro-6-deoxy-D-mannose reductase